jgi:hypothetical protein
MTDINKSVSGLNFSSPYDVETPFGTPNPPNHGMLIWSLGVTVVPTEIHLWSKHSIGLLGAIL